MKFYISCTSSQTHRAKALAQRLRDAGHEVVSTWHDLGDRKISDEIGWTEKIRKYNFPEIESADIHVAIQPGELVSGGMFVETGYALGKGKAVASIGINMNPLMEAPAVKNFLTEDEFFAELKKVCS